MNFIADALNLSTSAASRLEERNIIRRAFVKHPFFSDIFEAYRLDKKFGQYEEGTVVLKTVDGLKVVRGFPKIRRILTLDPALKRHFGERIIAVEEKMNGYNVRVIKAGENIYAITRRGILCPYTTEKARKLVNQEFFEEFPDYMLCCEAVGEESPYVPTDLYGIRNLEFFLFDIRKSETNEALDIETKEEIASDFKLKMAPVLSRISSDNVEAVRDIVEELNSKKREGVVFKDIEMRVDPLKYTTSFANCNDLRYAFRYFNEYGRDFMLSRIVREAFQSFEFGETGKELEQRCLRLGSSILLPLIESIREVKGGATICERVRLRFESVETLELFKEHLRLLGIDFRLEVERTEPEVVVVLGRVMRGTTDKITGILRGALWR
jgi:putative ATP-dependent DNA ligase